MAKWLLQWTLALLLVPSFGMTTPLAAETTHRTTATRAALTTTRVADATQTQNVDALLKSFDNLYHFHRHEPGGTKKCRDVLDEAITLSGEPTYGLAWRMAQLHFWIAEGQGNDEQMAAVARKGWDWGQKAVDLKPGGVEGNFWLAVNIGQYSLAVGILRAITNGLEGKFVAPLDKAIAIDPRYECAGPLRVKGNYHQNLPWPKRDLPEAIALLQKSLKLEPCGIRSRLYLAKAYEKDDNLQEALAQLDLIINAEPNHTDPGDLPRMKKKAREMKARLQQ